MKQLIIILSLFTSVMSAQRIIVVDENTGKEYNREFSNITKSDTIIGLPDHLKVYFVLRKLRPDYDPMVEKLRQIKRFTDSIADGNKYPYVVIGYEKTLLSDDEIRQNKELAVLEKEMELLINSISEDEFRQYVVMGLAALIYQSRGGNLSSSHNEIMDIIFDTGLKTFQNRENKKQLIQDLQINPKNVDITKNWTK